MNNEKINALKARRIRSTEKYANKLMATGFMDKDPKHMTGDECEQASNLHAIVPRNFDNAFKAGAILTDFDIDVRNAFFL